jgi:alginate O-acetyltransferase complex protein AlgI
MVFSSPVFLFLFLPITLAVYYVVPKSLRNLWLLAVSLVFYGWGEPKFLVVMLASIACNFLLALWIERLDDRGHARRVVALAVVVNIGLLVVFKYTNFIVDTANALIAHLGMSEVANPPIALPIGISFFTFHALSYVIDVYRGDARALRNPFDMGLYISLFSQLVAGPIIRYHDVANQLRERSTTRSMFARGVERFIVGLGKKVLVANTLAVPADLIFSLPPDQLTGPVAWFGVACYTLQIYFDFSGYSDMAIGLGLMFGFRFLENFNYPYISRSITEFWRRWHISLSNWFRDYLYIPLGGNRVPLPRVYLNLVTTFFLCGLWHGASINFIVWGLYHGAFLVVERMGATRWMAYPWTSPLRHVYVLLVVMVSWVFFRAGTLPEATTMLKAMAGLGGATASASSLAMYIDTERIIALAVGVVGATPILPAIKAWIARAPSRAVVVGGDVIELIALPAILVASAMLLAAGTYNPFIYFRF